MSRVVDYGHGERIVDYVEDDSFQLLRHPVSTAKDEINHPEHYTQGGIECIEAIKAALTEEEWRGYCKGNALKYVWRERLKGKGQDLKKAGFYLNKLTA